MTERKRKAGFTLVELLVVIALIATLFMLVVPRVHHSRERARTLLCTNNLKQLQLALILRESRIGYFPGYINSIGTPNKQLRASWVVSTFQDIEKTELFDSWSQGKSEKEIEQPRDDDY